MLLPHHGHSAAQQANILLDLKAACHKKGGEKPGLNG
jgi:hypothetical protein